LNSVAIRAETKISFSHFREMFAKIFAKIRKIFEQMQTFSRKFLYKIDDNSGIVIDVEYLGHGASD
jgi:TATA-binding protein-associated factor Taf7